MVDSDIARSLLGELGTARPQPATDWDGNRPLPGPLAQFYLEVGPVDVAMPWPFMKDGLFFPSLAGLASFQGGFANDPDDASGQGWLVVASDFQDALIYPNTNEAVLFTDQSWVADPPTEAVFPDLNSMIGCLAVIGIAMKDDGTELYDEQGHVRAERRADVARRVADLVGDAAIAERIASFLCDCPFCD